MRGVIEGGYVFVTDDIELPENCKVLVQIVPAVLGAYDNRTPDQMTQEELAELEALLTELQGHPVKLAEDDPE
jgi:hypothetical protein